MYNDGRMPGSENDILNKVMRQIAKKNACTPRSISLSSKGTTLESAVSTTRYPRAAGPMTMHSVKKVNLRSLGHTHFVLELYDT